LPGTLYWVDKPEKRSLLLRGRAVDHLHDEIAVSQENDRGEDENENWVAVVSGQ